MPDRVANPSFNLTTEQARHALKDMRKQPVDLERPVIVIGGWGDVVALSSTYIAEHLRLATGDDRIIAVPGGMVTTFDDCRDRLIMEVNNSFPSNDPTRTIEVDVIGFSMGGIIARYAAIDRNDETSTPRLRIARLYTIASPHQGADIASRSKILDPLARDMHPDSGFMRLLHERYTQAPYPIIAYAQLDDQTIGTANSSPPGQTPWWLDREPFTRSHGGAMHDLRFIADIARRLRNETPYTTEPPASLPE